MASSSSTHGSSLSRKKIESTSSSERAGKKNMLSEGTIPAGKAISGSFRIAQRSDFNRSELSDMHQLRARVFSDRMGWDVPVISGIEIDEFDFLDPYYMMIMGPDNNLCGCWRLLPTEGPYMLKKVFPQLLHEHPVPEHPNAWELSRFAIMADTPEGFGFTALVMKAMQELVAFGDRMGIERFVTVTTVAIERMLRHANITVNRFGPPLRFGAENIVALDIDLGEATHRALFDL